MTRRCGLRSVDVPSRQGAHFSVTSAMDYMASLRRICAQHPGFSRGVLHDYVRPVAAPGGGVALEIECGPNAALMLLSRLCRGSSGRCILYKGSWLTPNEFQLLSGRETAKDWKRSIRHRGRSMKLLLTKGFLSVHETGCECAGCQQEDKLAATVTPCTAAASSDQPVSDVCNPGSMTAAATWGSPPPSLQITEPDTSPGESGAEKRRGESHRLSSIIEQLRAGSTRTSLQHGEGHGDSEVPPSTELLNNNNNNNTVQSSKPRKRRGAASSASIPAENRMSASPGLTSVKSERLSPGGDTPNSPDSVRHRVTPSSFPSGTPPAERGSPSAASAPSTQPHHPALKQMEQMMNRNYSDFMRSLAAKYNNSNPNDYFSSPRNGFLTGLDSRFSFGKSSGTSPFPGLAPLATTGAAAATTPPTGREEGKSKSADLSLFHQQAASSASAGSQPQSAALLAAAAAANLGHPLGFPLIDMSSTQALINMVRSASAQNASQLENYLKGASNKRGSEPLLATGLGPLDLSSAPPPVSGGKRPRLYAKSEASLLPAEERAKSASVSPKPPPRSGSSSSASSGHSGRCLSLCTDKPCQPESQAVSHWSVDDVCAFVASIDLCAEYVPAFREQAIDGSALPLLTEEHLTTALGLKLGPALKLRAVLARRLGHCALCLHCVHCHGASSTTSAPSPAPSPQQRPAPPPPLQ